uniref:G-protein coupled receptors family 1 profile domain-containing protein n=1 Tax=Leptobrachium leishanense TaxID=445787 RepID=A0A8C5PAT1_9ANUR
NKISLSRQNPYSLPLTTVGLIICIAGLIGNGIVFCFLCFKMKRRHFTIYIINLSIADFTYLFGLCVLLIYMFSLFTGLLYNFGFNAGIYLLTVISLERCIAVICPLWYQCQRPKRLTTISCTSCWTLSVLVTGLEQFVCTSGQQYLNPGSEYCTNVYFFTSALYIIVVLVLVVSSFTLLFDIQKASKHCHPPKLYIVIIVSATVFLISVIPARILGLLLYFKILNSDTLMLVFFYVTSLCSAFNCSTNPYIYMVVGRFGKRVDGGSNIKQLLEKHPPQSPWNVLKGSANKPDERSRRTAEQTIERRRNTLNAADDSLNRPANAAAIR